MSKLKTEISKGLHKIMEYGIYFTLDVMQIKLSLCDFEPCFRDWLFHSAVLTHDPESLGRLALEVEKPFIRLYEDKHLRLGGA